MKARDVMTSPVITISPTESVKEVARLLHQHRISGVPVVDRDGKLVGIVSEGDLLHRSETGTGRKRSWWLGLLADDRGRAADYIKEHSKRVADVMTTDVTTATPDTPLSEIAMLIEKNGIKRVPIVHERQIIGIVSRANLVQAFATSGTKLDIPETDAAVRERVLSHLKAQPWVHTGLLNATVHGGVVDLWGMTESDIERKAIRVAAESIPGVRAVNDRMTVAGAWLAAS
jgi:CBS domain-containing protein